MTTTIDLPEYNGYVEIIDVMGNDQAIIDSVLGFWQPQTITRDQDFINYLYRVKHTTPFETCEVKFRLKLIGNTIQKMLRHRFASINISSIRFQNLNDSFFDTGDFPNSNVDNLRPTAELIFKLNLHNFFEFILLRIDPEINDALLNSSVPQDDIHAYATAMYNLVKERFPMACVAFEKYDLKAVRYNNVERQALALVWSADLENACVALGMTPIEITHFKNKVTRMDTK